MIRKLLITTLAATVIAGAAAPAMANSLFIEQYGFGNNARPLFRAPSYRASSIMIEGRTAHSIKLR